MSIHSMDRRIFLGSAGAAAAASLLPAQFLRAVGQNKIDKIGVQLYTVRDLLKDDFEGTIAKVAKIGYKEVEFAGYFGRTANQVKAVLGKNGLKATSVHVEYDELDDRFPSVIEFSKSIGLNYIICGWISDERRKSPDIWKQASDKFNKCAEQISAAGMMFGYHNHWFEFFPTNGEMPYDELLRLCDPTLVKMEMDLCWIMGTGADPLKYFNKYPDRFPLVHVKDTKTIPKMTSGGEQNFFNAVELTEVGSGLIDWRRIFAQADKAGIKHYIVELDNPKQPIESIKTSYDYLNKLRF